MTALPAIVEHEAASTATASADETVTARFAAVVQHHGDRTALASAAPGGSGWHATYRELNAVSAALAAHVLERTPWVRGDGDAIAPRVALLMRHDTPLIAAALAVLKAGRVVIVLNSADPPARLLSVLADAEPALILADASHAPLARELKRADVLEVTVESLVADVTHLLGLPAAACDSSPPLPTDLAFLIYTSGSTGAPKAVMQTHRNIVHNVRRLMRGMALAPDDRVALLASPAGGQGMATLCCSLLAGAALHPFPVVERGVTGLAAWLRDQRITVFISSASLFRPFVRTLEQERAGPATTLPGVRLVRLGSEPATGEDAAAFHRHFGEHCKLLNTYSSSETGNIAQHLLTHADAVRVTGSRLPAGRPVDGMLVRLLDDDGRDCAPGATGEIIVRSGWLSPGYWRSEALTAERFSSDASQRQAEGERTFRTGDLAKRAEDGTLIYMGRKDGRVKVHGHRVEPLEIEEALFRCCGVQACVVAIDDDRSTSDEQPGADAPAAAGEDVRASSSSATRLVACVLGQGARTQSPAELREALRSALPAYMIPARFVALEALPRAPTGKIDRERIRRELMDGAFPPAACQPPTASAPPQYAKEIETLVAQAWRDALDSNTPPIARDADFFELGGDSLAAAVVAAQVHAALGVQLDLRCFADAPRLCDLCALIEQRRVRDADGFAGAAPGGDRTTPPPVRIARGAPMPLSFSEERTWRFSQTPEASAPFTVACSHRIIGPLDVAALRECFRDIVQRHESLRTTFAEVGGQPMQVAHPLEACPTEIPLVDCSHLSAEEAEAHARGLLQGEARKGFDLTRLPLLKLLLVRIAPGEHHLLRVNHHIISDPWSWQVFFRELARLYEARIAGQPRPLRLHEPLQFADYAAWQRRALIVDGAMRQETLAWWRTVIAGAERGQARPLELPFGRAEPKPEAAASEGLLWWGIDAPTSAGLRDIARELGATHFTLRLAAFTALLAHDSGQDDLVVGSYFTNRHRLEVQGMFGFFSNLMALRMAPPAGSTVSAMTFADWLAHVRRSVIEAQARSEMPYELVCESLWREGIVAPEIRAIFSVSDHNAPLRFGGLEVTWIERRMESMPWGFTLSFDQHHEQTHCRCDFDARQYDPAAVAAFTTRLGALLPRVCERPRASIGNLLI